MKQFNPINEELHVMTKLSQHNQIVNTYPIKASFPDRMMIEITNACNHRCVFCYNSHSQRKLGFIDIALFKRIVDDGAVNGIEHLALHTTGEAFLHKRLPRLIEIAQSAGIAWIYITSNGALCTPTIAYSSCMKAGLSQIKFSVNAASL